MFRILPYIHQVKMLNNIYGAACDHQYMLNGMPQLPKRVITRPISDEPKERQKNNLELLRSFAQSAGIYTAAHDLHMPVEGVLRKRGRRRRHSKKAMGRPGRSHLRIFESSRVDLAGNERDGQGICEECGGPLHLPRAPSKKRQRDKGKLPNKIPGVGADIKRKPEVQECPNIFDNWRDPLTTRIQIMNPPDEKMGFYRGVNVAMI